MAFRRFTRIIRARWRTTSIVFGCFVIAAAAISVFMPRQYIATASVVLDAKADPVAGVMNPDQLSLSYLATQLDIVNSRRVAQRAVKLLHLDDVPQFRDQWQTVTGGRGELTTWLASNLQRRVTATPGRESNVINISVKWPNAKAAATIANAFAQAYIDTTIDLKVEPAKQYAGWFEQRSNELHLDLEAKQKRLSDFQKDTQITATDERLDIENARLAELSSQLTAIQAQRQDSQSRQQQIAGDNETLPEVLQSPVIVGLKADLALAEAKLNDIATTLGKNHPAYQTTEAEVASLRERMDKEIAKVAASLGNITKTNLRREEEVRAALEEQKKHVLDLKHERDEVAVLQSDVATAQRNLDTVTQRLAQSDLESQVQHTDVISLTDAVEPLEPYVPKIQLNMVLGIFLGIAFGVGTALLLEMANPRIRIDEDVARLLSIPLLGRIRPAKAWITYDQNSPPALTHKPL